MQFGAVDGATAAEELARRQACCPDDDPACAGAADHTVAIPGLPHEPARPQPNDGAVLEFDSQHVFQSPLAQTNSWCQTLAGRCGPPHSCFRRRNSAVRQRTFELSRPRVRSAAIGMPLPAKPTVSEIAR